MSVTVVAIVRIIVITVAVVWPERIIRRIASIGAWVRPVWVIVRPAVIMMVTIVPPPIAIVIVPVGVVVRAMCPVSAPPDRSVVMMIVVRITERYGNAYAWTVPIVIIPGAIVIRPWIIRSKGRWSRSIVVIDHYILIAS